MAAPKKKKAAKKTPEARLALLHAAKLFTQITVDDFPAVPNRDLRDALAEAIDRNPGEMHETYRAPQSIPEVVAEVVVEVNHGVVRITRGRSAGLYEPRTHHEWAAIVDAGLAALGDSRRMIALRGIDWEEPLFVLATPAEAKAIRAAQIADNYNEISLPMQIDASEMFGELAKTLERKLGVKARAADDEVILELAADEVSRLVDKLYVARFADTLVAHRVKRDYS